MSQFASKDELIEHVIFFFSREGGEKYLHTSGKGSQKDSTEVFLLDDFQKFLKKKYPNLNNSDIQEILKQIKSEDKYFHDFNRCFFQKLRAGHPFRKAGGINSKSIQLIDFENVHSNIFRIVDRKTFSASRCEIDLIIYINGIPLVVWAFKDPNEKLQGAETLINGDLSSRLPELLKYNAFCVICNGINRVRYGISWGSFNDYKEWKRVSEKTGPSNTNILFSTIRGLFNKERLVKVIESFICFHDSEPSKKVICRYPQFFGAIKLLKSIEIHSKGNPKGDGKGGIYFGAAGCGKSYTMLFLTKLLQKSKYLNNPTVLLITDRRSLDRQLHNTFKQHQDFLSGGELTRMRGGMQLWEVFRNSHQGGIYFSTIQKFKNFSDITLSNRPNIICIADEAHRSQDFSSDKWVPHESEGWKVAQPLSQILRTCLPAATYVGFTATPKTSTLQVFGDVVDAYGMQQSVDDGFTVDIEIEWITKEEFRCDDEIAEEMKLEFQKMIDEGVPIKQVRQEEKKRTTEAKAYSNLQRLEIVAKDIVARYERRVNSGETVEGKAMIVTYSKQTACEYYKLLKQLKPEWFENDDPDSPAQSMVNVVVSRHDTDTDEIKKFTWNSKTQNDLLESFKQPKSSFKIAIVCEMWLTGVDIPSLDTMFLDDHITNPALLIQSLSRVNRIYPKKKRGLVVSYRSLQKHLDRALSALSELGGRSEIINLNEVAEHVKRLVKEINQNFQDKYDGWVSEIQFFCSPDAKSDGRIQVIERIIQWINKQDKLFINLFEALSKEMCKCFIKCRACDLFDKKERRDILFFGTLYRSWLTPKEEIPRIFIDNLDEMEKDLFIVLEENKESFSILDTSLEYSPSLHSIEESDWSHKSIEEIKDEVEAFRTTEGKRPSEKEIYFIERIEALIRRLNSARDEAERGRVEEEVRRAYEDWKEEYTTEMEAREREKTFLNGIIQELNLIKEKYQFEYSEEKLENLAQELKKINDSYEEFMGQDIKIETERKIRKEMKDLFSREQWPPPPFSQSTYKPKDVRDVTAKRLFQIFQDGLLTKKKS